MEDRDKDNVVRRPVGPSGQTTAARALDDPATWVDEHGDALFRYALLRVRERATAEDVVQETFLAAVKSKNEFQGGSEVRTWLIGILRHKIGDHFRKNGREVQAEGTDDADPTIDNWFDKKGFWVKPPRTWDVNPAELAERQEFWLVLQGCMDALPGRAGEAFSLRVVNDTEADEVCKVLGITTTNLWVLLHRARARLRACLEEKWFDRQPKESA
jgi:RNA polymerase sigma-70 factor (ECF subfamily)